VERSGAARYTEAHATRNGRMIPLSHRGLRRKPCRNPNLNRPKTRAHNSEGHQDNARTLWVVGDASSPSIASSALHGNYRAFQGRATRSTRLPLTRTADLRGNHQGLTQAEGNPAGCFRWMPLNRWRSSVSTPPHPMGRESGRWRTGRKRAAIHATKWLIRQVVLAALRRVREPAALKRASVTGTASWRHLPARRSGSTGRLMLPSIYIDRWPR